MVRPTDRVEPHPCPEWETLVAFLADRLDRPARDAVRTHVAGCTVCEEVLSELSEEGDDALGGRIGACLRVAGPPTTEERAYRLMEARAKALSVGGTASDEVGDFTMHLPPDALTHPEVGPYLTLEAVGHGGMGVVYRARHRVLNREVALKMIRAGVHAGPETVARFRTEGEAVARLHHPNIARLYDYGEHDGLPYFAMEWVDGGTVAARLAARSVGRREAAGWVQTVAGAMQYAHDRGVLHRDLKPANILLTAAGVPKVADFGLAKLLDADGDGLTLTEQIFGTPSYMAVEQAQGRTDDIGPHTDVYALGAILYETLTLRPPYVAKTKFETLNLVIGGALVPPSRLVKDLSPDLEAVCLKCLEQDPAKRYKSAGALADDLGRWLAGEPTAARPLGRLGRAIRAAKKQWRAAAAVLGLLAVAGVVAAAWYPRGTQLDHASHADPRELRLIEPELLRGNPVTLIGATGRPKWYRWQNGTGRGSVAVDADGTFTATHPGVGLLELLPDPTTDRYRLTAQVRHDRTMPEKGVEARVGVFVAHVIVPRKTDDIHLHTRWTFNSVWRSVFGKETNPAGLVTALLIEEGRPAPDVTAVRRAGPPVKALGESNDRWFDLDVTVTPNGVGAGLRPLGGPGSDRTDKHREPWLAADEMNGAIRRAIEPLKPPSGPPVGVGFVPRGGLGLVIEGGTAAFRNVVVTPLPPGIE